MEYRTVAMIAAAIIAGMVVASAWTLAALPANAMVPIHFGLDGRPDSWAHPLVGLSLLPASAIAGLAVFVLLAHNAQGGLARSGTAFRTTLLAVTGLLGTIHGIIIASAMGHEVNVTRIMVLLVGVLMVVIGNVKGASEPLAWDSDALDTPRQPGVGPYPSFRRMDICRSRSHVGNRGLDRSRERGVGRNPALDHRHCRDRALHEVLSPLAQSTAHLTLEPTMLANDVPALNPNFRICGSALGIAMALHARSFDPHAVAPAP